MNFSDLLLDEALVIDICTNCNNTGKTICDDATGETEPCEMCEMLKGNYLSAIRYTTNNDPEDDVNFVSLPTRMRLMTDLLLTFNAFRHETISVNA